MKPNKRIGIIDIGSNSVRLGIYEQTGRLSHRVIDESKKAARLSERIGSDGRLGEKDILALAETLEQFKLLCSANRTAQIRAVATAAIRNAANSAEIVAKLIRLTGLDIEVLSGKEEARLGFVGMINSLSVEDGFLVDIGGGSTEVTLFRNRKIVNSVSFPFGSVNTAKRFSRGGLLEPSDLALIRRMVEEAVRREPWIRSQPGLPLIGLGGTIRTLGKLVQRQTKYSLPMTHNFDIAPPRVESVLDRLTALSLEKRNKLDGVSKDRADIIVPGLVILQTLFRQMRAAHYKISGAGLRDGLLFEAAFPGQPVISDVAEYSVRHMLSLYPSVPLAHVEQVNRLALKLFDDLAPVHGLGESERRCLHTASLLYRIGVAVNFYSYSKHTFYLMAHSRMDGLTHREILLCGLIASYKTKNRTRHAYLAHKDILSEPDCSLAVTLGTLLRLAAALDRSETQPVAELTATAGRKTLDLHLQCSRLPQLETAEVETVEKEFKKVWGLTPRCRAVVFSTI
ncbi:Ppx/GppA phosphatase family protein [Paenibacillus aurantius]|uniref:Ppx/GppA phosphatase family protein n=1 Tax=Paenibacillus aurantius TaxID=2918900 RepID=A0AA96LB90_9BACL|nr:Ppx/GppA phosphatase family protein [Paenibacillus aurantius]WNQ09934.1 Ppx/GppA phosphatase family protein [Paenibacillus aurantius]